MPTVAAYPGMMQRARKREGLRECRAASLVGVSLREYREIEAGDRTPSPSTYERISELYGWPQPFVSEAKVSARWPRPYDSSR
jgi:transcriptional regulator with XRE-family HTH domain